MVLLAGTRVIVPPGTVAYVPHVMNGWPGTVTHVTNDDAIVVLDGGWGTCTETIGTVLEWIALTTPNVSPRGRGVCPEAPDAPGPLSHPVLDRVVRTLFT